MEVLIKHNKDIIDGNESKSCFIYNDTDLKVSHYLILSKSGVGVNNYKDGEEKYPQENIYFVLNGKIEIVVGDKRYILDQYDSVRILGYGAFSIWGIAPKSLVISLTAANSTIAYNSDELFSMIEKSEINDPYTKNHNARVGRLASKIANAVIPHKDISHISLAGSLHDIGKSMISEKILNKPGKLTKDEFDEIKKHPVYSYEIVKDKLDEDISFLIRHHHEYLDGTGYPDGLKGEEINIETRILTCADIFDALTSDRVYRNKYTAKEAIQIMESMGKKLDENVVSVLKQLLDNNTINYYEDKQGYC